MINNAYQILSDRVKSGEIPFDEAEECASMWGRLGIELHFWNWHNDIIHKYMENLE